MFDSMIPGLPQSIFSDFFSCLNTFRSGHTKLILDFYCVRSCFECDSFWTKFSMLLNPPINRINFEWNNWRPRVPNSFTSFEKRIECISLNGLLWKRTTSQNSWMAILLKSKLPFAIKVKKGVNSSNLLLSFRCSVTLGRRCCRRCTMAASSSPSTNISISSSVSSPSVMVVSWFKLLDEQSPSSSLNSLLCTHLDGVFTFCILCTGLQFGSDVGMINFQRSTSSCILSRSHIMSLPFMLKHRFCIEYGLHCLCLAITQPQPSHNAPLWRVVLHPDQNPACYDSNCTENDPPETGINSAIIC